MNPMVSVVIPSFEAAEYLPDAIESVLSQTYPALELIVVDDGSTDETEAVVKKYDGVRYIRQVNRGPAAARNRGVDEAVGEFVAFLDADDVWMANKLETQMAIFASDPDICMVYTGFFTADQSLRLSKLYAPAPPRVALVRTVTFDKPIMTAIGSSAVVRRHVFDSVRFDERLPPSEDWALACEIARRYPIGCVDEGLVIYRQHPDQGHLDLEAIERAAMLKYEEWFAGESSGVFSKRHRRRGESNLFASLALGHVRRGRWKMGGRYALRAFLRNPWTLSTLVWRQMKYGRGRRANPDPR